MTLGEFIKTYRSEHNISMDNFSEISGISKSYISLLEKNRQPKTGKPITPSIKCIQQVADCVHIDFRVLFSMLYENIPLSDDYSPSKDLILSDDEKEIIIEYRNLNKDGKNMIKRMLEYSSQLSGSHKDK